MNRRNFLSTALGVPALAAMAGSLSTLLAACGDDEAATEPSYADGPNDVVLSIRYEGGFVPMGFAFVNTPTLLVSGDGRVFEPGMQTLEFPGPLLSPVMVRPISAAGIRKVIRLAGDAGLLSSPAVQVRVAAATMDGPRPPLQGHSAGHRRFRTTAGRRVPPPAHPPGPPPA